jgi:hypothetical protein
LGAAGSLMPRRSRAFSKGPMRVSNEMMKAEL